MQVPKSNFNQLGSNLNPLKDATGIAAIDYSADIDNLIGKLDKLQLFMIQVVWTKM